MLQLRTQLQSANSCSFEAQITADYTDAVYTFTLECIADEQGNITFTVCQPDTVQGITGIIDQAGGKLTFDDAVLVFEPLVDDLVTPVISPWLVLKMLRSGYISSVGQEQEQIHCIIDDSYAERPLQLDVWLDSDRTPKCCEILWQGRRIVSVTLDNFEIV